MNLQEYKAQLKGLQRSIEAYQSKIDKATMMRDNFAVELELCQKALLDELGYTISERHESAVFSFDVHDKHGQPVPDKYGRHTIIRNFDDAVMTALQHAGVWQELQAA